MPALSPLPRSHAAVRARLGELPLGPGVYMFRDRSRRLLYVGKSVCLRQRVRSYFGEAAGRYRKVRRLRSRAAAVEWIETGSELEALLLESRLVKEQHPPFNALLHRHRHLVFLRLDLKDPFPRFEVTEKLRRDGARYFGPLVLTADAERLADILSDTLRLRTCEAPGHRVHLTSPCLRHDMGLCHSPCLRPTDADAYQASVRAAAAAFEREGRAFRERLRGEMEEAAERLLFERAARLRDALRSLDGMAGRQGAVISAVDALDLVAACPSRREEHVELFLFSGGRFVDQHTVARERLREPEGALETARGFLRRRDAPAPADGSEVEPEVLDQLFLIARWLRLNSGEGRHFLLPADEDPSFLALRLGAWLRETAVDLVVEARPDAGAPVEEPGEEWAEQAPDGTEYQVSSRR
jgi:excinuclease UvrABC nuclease subunit